MHRLLALSCAAFAAVPAPAQDADLVAASWDGRLLAIDSRTGATAPIGSGLFGQNDLVRDGQGQLWSTARVGAAAFWLTRVDAVRGEAAFAWPSVDLRGLAPAPNGLFGIEPGPSGTPARLWRVDTATGQQTLVGSTGARAIQSLCVQNGTLYGWSWVDGLLVIDQQTGAATDPFPNEPPPPVVQWLQPLPGGHLIGGSADALLQIDVSTGAATTLAPLAAADDVRGAAFAPMAMPFGRGCDVGPGPLQLSASGSLQPGGALTLRSGPHLPRTVRGLALGFSRRSYLGQPLPLSLDPLLGTSGCQLYTSIDFSLLVPDTSSATTLSLPLALPAALGAVDLYAQAFELPVPWQAPGSSNGLLLHILP